MTDPGRRLTSWKAIASYLGREVRTAMRWEKERDLPIHRGPDGRSGVVFADMDELDAWTRGHKAEPESALPDPLPSVPVARTATKRWSAATAAVAVVAVAIGLGGWRVRGSGATQLLGRVVMTDRAVIARNADGSEKWRHDFVGETALPPFARLDIQIEPLGGEGVLAATGQRVGTGTMTIRSGQLMWFDPAGRVKRTFSFDDRVTFGSRAYSQPWALTDYQVKGGRAERRIAIASHHEDWWPSIVTILDGQWRRESSFIHAGWVEFVRWLPGDRLAIAGFSNLKDAGMVALLDAGAIHGQSPAPPDGEFHCTDCGPDRPVRYVVMPRSEVNRASAAPFNRARVTLRGDALLVSTEELPQPPTTVPAHGFYEFTQQLHLVHASYSDRYWDAHLELERAGKITHTRQQCPEREGPRQIEIWEPATGWRVQPVTRSTATRRP